MIDVLQGKEGQNPEEQRKADIEQCHITHPAKVIAKLFVDEILHGHDLAIQECKVSVNVPHLRASTEYVSMQICWYCKQFLRHEALSLYCPAVHCCSGIG